MNVTLPEKNRLKKKQIIIYSSIILICVISVIVAFYVQFYARIDISKLFGVSSATGFGNKTEEETENLKSEFNQIFSNNIENDDGKNDNKKVEEKGKLVYTLYEKKESKLNSYDLEVHIPYINIKNDVTEKYNEEIENVFANIARNILNSENKNIIYTVEYEANIEEDILSVIIKSNLKEGSNAQKVIIQTYNYDLRNNKEITLEEVLKIKHLDTAVIQNKIDTSISAEQEKVKNLKELGYNIYSRDTTSNMYKVEKNTEFYLTKDALYIIYAYGNNNDTSEMDLIVI